MNSTKFFLTALCYFFPIIVLASQYQYESSVSEPACIFTNESYPELHAFIRDFKTRSAFSYAGLILWKAQLKDHPMSMPLFKRVRESVKAMAHLNLELVSIANQSIYNQTVDPNCIPLLNQAYIEVVYLMRKKHFDVDNQGFFVNKTLEEFIKSVSDFYLISLHFYRRQFALQDQFETDQQLLDELWQAGKQILLFEDGNLTNCHWSYRVSSLEQQSSMCPLFLLGDDSQHLIPDVLLQGLHFPRFAKAKALKGLITTKKFVEAERQELEAFSAFRKSPEKNY